MRHGPESSNLCGHRREDIKSHRPLWVLTQPSQFYAQFEVLTAVVSRVVSSVVEHRIIWETSAQISKESFASIFLQAGFLLGLHINTENGGDMYLRNIGWSHLDYMALYCRRYKYPSFICICSWELLSNWLICCVCATLQNFTSSMAQMQRCFMK
jgi:hypothetical protein